MKLFNRTSVDLVRLLYIRKIVRRHQPLVISFWHEFHKPPYGGGNQFMLALQDAFERQGVVAVHNVLSPLVDVHICNSAWFDTRRFEARLHRYSVRMIHRIDGPVGLYRGAGEEEDKKIHALNGRFASATVYQSQYCYQKSLELGHHAVSPVVIHNAVNGAIFHANDRAPFSSDRKIRLISSAWSDNPRKGGPLLKWLDSHLDWNRFEYTFVGRVQQHFDHIKHIPPQDSKALADLLRRHDIYISASQHEPCSNALLEAMACGLPTVYRNDGGNPELVGKGGLPFENEGDILAQLDDLVADYEQYRSAIVVKSMSETAAQYIQLARQVMDRRS